jgi:hypothetical protein
MKCPYIQEEAKALANRERDKERTFTLWEDTLGTEKS